MQHNSKEFKKLQAAWYKKLACSGFDDIETDEDTLEQWHSHWFKSRDERVDTDAIQEYYRLAGQFLHSYKFESKKEQVIWECHVEGLSVRDTVSVMKTRRFRVYRRLVHETIQRLRKQMVKK